MGCVLPLELGVVCSEFSIRGVEPLPTMGVGPHPNSPSREVSRPPNVYMCMSVCAVFLSLNVCVVVSHQGGVETLPDFPSRGVETHPNSPSREVSRPPNVYMCMSVCAVFLSLNVCVVVSHQGGWRLFLSSHQGGWGHFLICHQGRWIVLLMSICV